MIKILKRDWQKIVPNGFFLQKSARLHPFSLYLVVFPGSGMATF